MMLMAERYRLRAYYTRLGEIRRADKKPDYRRKSENDKYRSENAHPGQGIRTAMKNLRHNDTSALFSIARSVPGRSHGGSPHVPAFQGTWGLPPCRLTQREVVVRAQFGGRAHPP